jgi:hypothetical protein
MTESTAHATASADRGLSRLGALSRVSWGAVFAGLVIATALQVTLTVLGAAIGLTALDGPDSGKAFGVGAAIWALLVPLVTLFVGGMTAGRLANVRDRGDNFVHGALVWALSLLLAAYLIGTGASKILGGTLSLAGSLGGGAANAAGQLASRSDLDPSDIRQTANAVQDSAAAHGVTQEDVRARAAQVRQQAGQVADKAQGIAAGGAWLALLALGLSLAAAVLGARRALNPEHEHVRATTTTTPGRV